MADALGLCCCNINTLRYSYSPCLLTSLNPTFLPFSLSSTTIRAPGPTPTRLSFIPRKRLSSFKVHGAVAETTDQPKWWEKNAGPNMIDVHSTEEFLSALKDAKDRLVVVEFYGTWCASCRALFPRLCRMAEDHPEILFIKVNFDENKAMCKSMNVKVLPYFQFYRGADGKLEEFSCSLSKFQKIRDAIETYNPAQNDVVVKVINDPSTNVDDNPSKSNST